MALNRVVAHLDDSLTAKVAEYAAASGITFDEALASHIVAASTLFEAVADQSKVQRALELEDDESGRLSYALAKQLPAMESGFSIETSYGPIEIPAEHAPAIMIAVRSAIENELAARVN